MITDLTAPNVLDHVKLERHQPARPNAIRSSSRSWLVPGTPNTEFILPGSFGLYTDDGSEPRVQIDVTGYKGDPDLTPLIVTHRSVLNLISQQTLFLRESLVAGCKGNHRLQARSNQTCIEGRCVDSRIDPRTLPKFRAELHQHRRVRRGTHVLQHVHAAAILPRGRLRGRTILQRGAPATTRRSRPTSPSWHTVPSSHHRRSERHRRHRLAARRCSRSARTAPSCGSVRRHRRPRPIG